MLAELGKIKKREEEFTGMRKHSNKLLMRTPVKSHTLTAPCRTVGTKKYWHKVL
jgi:hypothetical protein